MQTHGGLASQACPSPLQIIFDNEAVLNISLLKIPRAASWFENTTFTTSH